MGVGAAAEHDWSAPAHSGVGSGAQRSETFAPLAKPSVSPRDRDEVLPGPTGVNACPDPVPVPYKTSAPNHPNCPEREPDGRLKCAALVCDPRVRCWPLGAPGERFTRPRPAKRPT